MSDIEKSGLTQVLEAMHVYPDPADIEAEVAAIRARANGANARELSQKAIRGVRRRMTGAGAVAALPGAVPGWGTAAQVAVNGPVLSGEVWFLMRSLATMQLTVAGLHGHDVTHPDRRDELIIVLGLETGAIIPATEAGKRVGTKVAISQFNKRVSGAVLRKINQKLGATVLTKWGTKRGGIALGRLIPFGVGIAVGSGVNYLTARGFGRALIRYYSDLLPGDEEVIVVH